MTITQKAFKRWNKSKMSELNVNVTLLEKYNDILLKKENLPNL